MKKVAILGIGNILLKDDGIGIHTVWEIEKTNWPSNVTVVDGGTSITSLLDVFIQNQKVIVIDSVKGGHDPGTIYRMTPEDLGKCIKSNSSLHDVQVFDLLDQIKLLGYDTEVVIIGVEPSEIIYEMELSEIVKAQIPSVIKWVEKEVEDANA